MTDDPRVLAVARVLDPPAFDLHAQMFDRDRFLTEPGEVRQERQAAALTLARHALNAADAVTDVLLDQMPKEARP